MRLAELISDHLDQDVALNSDISVAMLTSAVEREEWPLVERLIGSGNVPQHLVKRLAGVPHQGVQVALAARYPALLAEAGPQIRAKVLQNCTDDVARKIFQDVLEEPRLSVQRALLQLHPAGFAKPHEAYKFLCQLSDRHFPVSIWDNQRNTRKHTLQAWVARLGPELGEQLALASDANLAARTVLAMSFDISLKARVRVLQKVIHTGKVSTVELYQALARIPRPERERFAEYVAAGCEDCTKKEKCAPFLKYPKESFVPELPPIKFSTEALKPPTAMQVPETVTEYLEAPFEVQQANLEVMNRFLTEETISRAEVHALLEVLAGCGRHGQDSVFYAIDPFVRFAGDDVAINYWRTYAPERVLQSHGWAGYGTCCDFADYTQAPNGQGNEQTNIHTRGSVWLRIWALNPCRKVLRKAPLAAVAAPTCTAPWQQMFSELLTETLGSNPDRWDIFWLMTFNEKDTVGEALDALVAITGSP